MAKKTATNLLDLMTDADKAKVKAREARIEAQDDKITREWLGLAEFGYYFGWDGIKAVIDDVITLEQMKMLIDGARKIHSSEMIDHATVGIAIRTTKSNIFTDMMKRYYDDVKGVA